MCLGEHENMAILWLLIYIPDFTNCHTAFYKFWGIRLQCKGFYYCKLWMQCVLYSLCSHAVMELQSTFAYIATFDSQTICNHLWR